MDHFKLLSMLLKKNNCSAIFVFKPNERGLGFGVWGLGFGVWGLGDRKSVV